MQIDDTNDTKYHKALSNEGLAVTQSADAE